MRGDFWRHFARAQRRIVVFSVGFGGTLREAMREDDFGKRRHIETFKFAERPHISKSKVEQYDDAISLRTAESCHVACEDEASGRYVAAENVTYDLLISLYDINSRRLVVYRDYALSGKLVDSIKREINKLRGRHSRIEARLVGLQDGQDYKTLASLNDMLEREGVELVEVDLFGQDTRHVLFDAKLGTSFNILLEDRVYRPGELKNQLTMEQYERTLKANGNANQAAPAKQG